MKRSLAGSALVGALIVAAHAHEEEQPRASESGRHAVEERDWGAWVRPLGNGGAPRAPAPLPAMIEPADPEIDVVDAHWMALTMWGEGRSQGEEGMRAVGHVIHNRWKAKRHGAYVTETVSEAWQFSAWNEGDPNRTKMLNIDELPPETADHRLWQTAKRLAGEILAGRSADRTGGALFYHTTGVQPDWSKGVTPVSRIGNHLFFLAART